MIDYLRSELEAVLDEMDGVPETFIPELEIPNDPQHGDLATNAALQLARHLRRAPRQIAEEVVQRLTERGLDRTRIEEVTLAGPGFINFRFANTYLLRQLEEVLVQGEGYGRTATGEGKTALVEFVSVNPTGPLTVGHGRNAVLGDTIANLLDWSGYEVTREYYFNDAGRQMRVLAQSVRARYEALVQPDMPTKEIEVAEGERITVPATFPDEGYLGTYIIDIAHMLAEEHGDALLQVNALAPFQEAAQEAIMKEIDATLERLGIKMDSFFRENSVYENGAVDEVVRTLTEKGYVYEAEGATWFKTTEFGKEQDTVLVKSTGEPTYRLPDIAYHLTKYQREFDVIVDVFGADHIATIPDVLSAVNVLGYDPDRVEVVIYQFVTLVRGGEPVKMSTRRANYVTLDELMDEVGEDVTRFFFLMRSPATHLDFDLDLAKEASEKNPVFYLQYAHARICSIIRKAEEVGFEYDRRGDFSLLTHEAEIALMKELFRLPDEIRRSAASKEPHHIVTYLREVAVAFTAFYDHCRIIGEDDALATARMHLARATRLVLRNSLTVLGISAPERM